MFALGTIHLSTSEIHTVKPLEVDFPKGRLICVTGVSGSGKTTMILESLIPGLDAKIKGQPLPEHVKDVSAEEIKRIKLIDATPIGINIRSTVATYADVHDELRKAYARTPDAKERGYKAGDFSYNTGRLRCPVCDGTGTISLDVQFLPDVDIPCPECDGSRYSKDASLIRRMPKKGNRGHKKAGSEKSAFAVAELETESGKEECAERKSENSSSTDAKLKGYTLPELMNMSVDEALEACKDLPNVSRKLQVLHDLGLGYLTLGEETPSLSGGEAQRLKLASEMGRGQSDSVFVFDEPTIGLHPSDVETLLHVFQRLIDSGATVIVIEHDLDVIRNAAYIVDMGPGGGAEGGRIVACGTPDDIRMNEESLTGKYI